MQQNQVSVLSRNRVNMEYKQNELEHIEARNKMDICQKQVFLMNDAWLLPSSNIQHFVAKNILQLLDSYSAAYSAGCVMF